MEKKDKKVLKKHHWMYTTDNKNGSLEASFFSILTTY